MGVRRLRGALHLGRWLGPWSDSASMPAHVRVQDVRYDGVRARRYTPRKRKLGGTILLVPGVHFLGPDDPRFDRLAHVLAASGRLVVAPFLDPYRRLRVDAQVRDDIETVFEGLLADERPPQKPVVLSISFGSLPAFQLAGGRFREQVGQVITFGGYGHWESAVYFALTGVDVTGEKRPSDPLNRPVVYINMDHGMPHVAKHAERLRPYWLQFCEHTWGRPEMKRVKPMAAVAERIATGLDGPARAVFLEGCGVADPMVLAMGDEACRVAMASTDWEHLDPSDLLGNVACPVHVIHGMSDDVIPHSQVDAIVSALPPETPRSTYLTGMFAHTGAGDGVPLNAQARELWTMLRMLGALTS